MINILLGKKIDQTQKFLDDGTRIPVTEIDVPDNAIVQVKTLEKDKYSALQIGFGKKKKPTKPVLGHAQKAGLGTAPAIIMEIKIAKEDLSAGEENVLKAGSFLKVEEIFKPGDIVDVTGTSKGKGFAGVMKRHNFKGGPKTHGQSDRARAPGSIGQTTTPGRVYKGKRMAGRMGSETVTIKNLKVVKVDSENKKLYIAGLVPGVKNSIVHITRAGEAKNFVPLFEVKEAVEALREQELPKPSAEVGVVEKQSLKAETKVEAVEEKKIEENKPEDIKESTKKPKEGGGK